MKGVRADQVLSSPNTTGTARSVHACVFRNDRCTKAIGLNYDQSIVHLGNFSVRGKFKQIIIGGRFETTRGGRSHPAIRAREGGPLTEFLKCPKELRDNDVRDGEDSASSRRIPDDRTRL